MKRKESKSTGRYVEKIAAKKAKTVKSTRIKRAKEVATKEEGARSRKTASKGLVHKIVRNEDKSNKTIKRSTIAKVKRSKSVSKYK